MFIQHVGCKMTGQIIEEETRNNFKKPDCILVLTPAIVGLFVLLFALCFFYFSFLLFFFSMLSFVADIMK